MIYVCSLFEMEHYVRQLQPGYLVSLIQPELQPPTPCGLEPARHLRVAVHDVSEEAWGSIVPEDEHVRSLVSFLEERSRDEGILFHCYAGISRSTAGALIALAIDMEGRELEASHLLRRAAPFAQPNSLLIALADRILGREGRLVVAHRSMGPHEPAFEGRLVEVAPTPG